MKEKVTGWDYFWLAMTAFGGLGLEVVYAFFLEPRIYGAPMQKWTSGQTIVHWILTCLTWGAVAVYLICSAKKDCGFDLLQKGSPMKPWQWCAAAAGLILSLALNYLDWGGFKFIREFQNKGALLFSFQYVYYAMETVLFLFIIAFGQKACEVWFKNAKIPYGGILCGLTWGLAHIFTKGNLLIGISGIFYGFIFGAAYLLAGRDIRKSWTLLFLMFAF